jgi:hypothetical protein
MNNLDVEIYMNGVIKFFNENPKDLYNFVSEEKKSLFFDKIKQRALENSQKGSEVVLTQQQFIDICLEINDKEHLTKKSMDRTHLKTKWGYICWN